MEAYQELEREFAEWNELPPELMVACSSGTAALHLALEAFQLPPGSEVIVPDLTMIACARAVTLAGLKPVFVDCGPDLLINPKLVAQAVTEKTRAIMAVHIYGRVCDMEALVTVADQHDLLIIEDLAEAHGVRPHIDTDAACWSFYRNKIVAGEEGGAVAFSTPGEAFLSRQLRSLGFTEAHDFVHVPRGHNYRMSNAHAELVRASLRIVKANLRTRRWIESTYERYCPESWRMPARQAPWVYDLRIPGILSGLQTKIVRTLNEEGIGARHCFKPMCMQDEYRGDTAAYPVLMNASHWEAWAASEEVIYLLIQPGITREGQILRSFETIGRVWQTTFA